MKSFRITFRSEIYIDAETEEEADEIFGDLTHKETSDKSTFIEQLSIEEQ